MEKVYVETTVPSLLTANPSRDLIVAGRQSITRQWWQSAPGRFELLISEAVIEEISAGDPLMAAKRMEAVEGLRRLPMNADVRALQEHYVRLLGLPPAEQMDLLHVAFAVVYEVEYLLTWNCAHLANPLVNRRLQKLNAVLGLTSPTILTPAELGTGAIGES